MEKHGSGCEPGDQPGAGPKVRKPKQGRIDLLCCVGVLGLGLILGEGHRTEPKPQFLVFPPESGTNYCILLRTVDGDSVRLGLIIDVNTRLYGIDTPERGQEGFKEATDRLNHLLSQNEYVRVEWNGRGKFGRYLATLYADEDAETSINEQMVKEGFAKEYLP